ncbi:MAG TPA: hypothetical protein VK773_04100 [Acidimicrobiales bacterium]|jgi:hypothetical protein|nr:hypothetical protein [Acidimicrobiales bacterium]
MRLFSGGAAVVSAGYALGAAATTPFTWAADVMTAIPIALVAVLAAVRWPLRPDRSDVLAASGRSPSRHPYLGWVVLLAFVAGWELVEYLWRGARSAHPTLSSMADAFDAHYAGKAVAFFAWLWLGAAIVRAGTPVASASGRSS